VRGSRGARLAALLIAVILAAVFPFWANRSQPYYLQIAINIIIFAVLALSWDILARTGQLSLAHAAFYGLGAYTSALLTLRAGVPVVVAIILGGVVAMGAAGALGLIYGGFTYTKETHSAKLGPIVLQVKEKETVYVPIILSAGAIALGVLLLVAFRNK